MKIYKIYYATYMGNYVFRTKITETIFYPWAVFVYAMAIFIKKVALHDTAVVETHILKRK